MAEKRMTLDELATALEAKGLKGVSGTLPPIAPGTRKALEEFSRRHQEFLRKGEEYLKTPQWNSDGCCPKCDSKQYFDLYGGCCNKQCAQMRHIL